MAAACKSYLAYNVEDFLQHVSFIYLFFFVIHRYPPPFQSVLSLAQTTLVCISVRAVTLRRSQPISVLYLLSKGSLPEDTIKVNEGASLTIC